MEKLYIGLMSGTSLDGLDAVIVDFSTQTPKLLNQLSLSMPENLRSKLLDVCNATSISYSDLAFLDVEMARLSALAVNKLLSESGLQHGDIAAIGSHGQTIYHQPHGNHPTTVQIGDPNVICELTKITTIADFRRRDIAAQGQGAPLVPAFHHAAFHSASENRVILNIGGIANITFIPAASDLTITGFDTGPGNVLMDYWYSQHQEGRYDSKGDWAASGQIHSPLLEAFLADDYFTAAPPKSTGREKFNANWLKQVLTTTHTNNLNPANIQASLCELTALSITTAIKTWASITDKIIVCGGGAYNTNLIKRIGSNIAIPVESSTNYGIAPDWVEAMAFAWLAKQTNEGRCGNIASVTGATQAVILGGIYQR